MLLMILNEIICITNNSSTYPNGFGYTRLTVALLPPTSNRFQFSFTGFISLKSSNAVYHPDKEGY